MHTHMYVCRLHGQLEVVLLLQFLLDGLLAEPKFQMFIGEHILCSKVLTKNDLCEFQNTPYVLKSLIGIQ